MSDENPAVEVAEKKAVWIKTGTQSLYQHGPTGKFYTRYRLNGKRTWNSLDTTVYTVAKLRHAAKIKEVEEQRQTGRPDTEMRTMGDLLNAARKDVEDSQLAESTRRHYKMRFDRIERHWDGDIHKFAPSRVSDATISNLRNALLAEDLEPSVVNSILQSVAGLMATARRLHLAVYNPFENEDRQHRLLAKVTKKKLVLPTKADMERVFALMEEVPTDHYREPKYVELLKEQALNAAEHARFLAYSGMRWKEGNRACWEDINDGMIYVHGTKTETSSASIPIIPALAQLLEKMKTRRIAKGMPLKGPILLCHGSKVPMKKACAKLGMQPLNHHKMRHLFATIAIESNVPIITVAGWLRHADGGVLAMQTYGHLRNEHSIAQAKNVNFAPDSTAPTKSE